MTPEEARATDRDRLAEVLGERMHLGTSGRLIVDYGLRTRDLADAVLASDWLAEHDRRVRAEAVERIERGEA